MKKPRKDRGTDVTQVAPIVTLLGLMVANGQTLVVTLCSRRVGSVTVRDGP